MEKWNQKGLIPGPEESEEVYIRRVKASLALTQEFIDPALKEALPVVESLYGISPDWVPVHYSNHKLAPWHAGCAWFFQSEEKGPTSAFLQLRRHFKNHRSLAFGWLNRTEVIAHELVHVGRMEFEEPKFEEFFSYRTSPRFFHRFFGPIISSAKESLLFMLILFFLMILDLSLLYSGAFSLDRIVLWAHLLPIGLIGFGLLRLFLRHRQLHACVAFFQNLFQDEKKAWAFTYRLTDKEIITFGKISKEAFLKQHHTSFRWKFLTQLYLEDLWISQS